MLNYLINSIIENEKLLEEFYDELDWVRLSHSIITLRSQVKSLLREISSPPPSHESSNHSEAHVDQSLEELKRDQSHQFDNYPVQNA